MEDFDYMQPGMEQEESSQFDFGKFIKGFWKRKYIIIFLVIVFSYYFYNQAKNQIPIYRAQVFLKVKSADDTGILNWSRQAEMATRNFKERVAGKLGLALRVKSSSVGRNRDNIFSQFSTTKDPVPGNYRIKTQSTGKYYLWQLEGHTETLLDSALITDAIESTRIVNGFSFRLEPKFGFNDSQVDFQIRPFRSAVGELGNVSVRISKTGATMYLYKTGTNPHELAEDLNRIARVYVEETRWLKDRDQAEKLSKLQMALEVADQKVKETEAAIQNFHSNYPLTLDVEKESLRRDYSRYNRALEDLPRTRERLEELLSKLESNASDNPDSLNIRRYLVRQLVNFPELRDDPNLVLLNAKLKNLEEKHERMKEAFSEQYEPVKDIAKQLKQTQDEIITFASKHLNSLARKESEYREKKELIEAKLQEMPVAESKLEDLENRKQINQSLYNRYLSEIQKLSLYDAIENVEFEIMDPALPPSHPINPSKKQKVLIGGALGMLLGMIISIVIDFLDNKIRTIKDIEKGLKIDVIGAIPDIEFKDIPEYHDFEKTRQIDRQLVTNDYSPTPIGESYRALRTHLLFSDRDKVLRSLLITSVSPEEGKSFTASNLAIIFAQQRTNTLLVDADLRRGVLHNTFGLGKEPGFTNYLSNNATLSGVVQPTHIPNLSILSCGAMMPNPSELLGSFQMERFLEEARRKFDFILFDTPPLEAATDAVVLATQVDATILVVRAGLTNKKIAKDKLGIFETIPANLLGIILNGSDSTLVSNQYSYYHY